VEALAGAVRDIGARWRAAEMLQVPSSGFQFRVRHERVLDGLQEELEVAAEVVGLVAGVVEVREARILHQAPDHVVRRVAAVAEHARHAVPARGAGGVPHLATAGHAPVARFAQVFDLAAVPPIVRVPESAELGDRAQQILAATRAALRRLALVVQVDPVRELRAERVDVDVRIHAVRVAHEDALERRERPVAARAPLRDRLVRRRGAGRDLGDRRLVGASRRRRHRRQDAALALDRATELAEERQRIPSRACAQGGEDAAVQPGLRLGVSGREPTRRGELADHPVVDLPAGVGDGIRGLRRGARLGLRLDRGPRLARVRLVRLQPDLLREEGLMPAADDLRQVRGRRHGQVAAGGHREPQRVATPGELGGEGLRVVALGLQILDELARGDVDLGQAVL
jgi:hypothetical protein